MKDGNIQQSDEAEVVPYYDLKNTMMKIISFTIYTIVQEILHEVIDNFSKEF